MKKFFILFFMLVFACESIAGPIINCASNGGGNGELPETGKVQLVFGNGIITTKEDALNAAKETLKRLKASLSPEEANTAS